MRLLTTNYTLTDDWDNLGDPISNNIIGRSFFRLGIDLNINDSEGIQFKLLIVDEVNNFEMPENIIENNNIQINPLIMKLKNNTDQEQSISWEIDMTVQSLQIQTQALIVGASAGIITTAKYELGYRQ